MNTAQLENKILEEKIRAAVLAERERCAKIAETHLVIHRDFNTITEYKAPSNDAKELASAIREGKE